MKLTLPSVVTSSIAMSAKWLGVFHLRPERHRAERGGKFGTLSGLLTFMGELISALSNGRTASGEGDFLRRVLSFWMGSGVISF